MLKVTIYYNPGCSKCRKTLGLINAKADEVQIIEYLNEQLTSDELTHIINLGIAAKDLIRINEDEWNKLGLNIDECASEDLISAIISHPLILQRPIVLVNERAVIARPPERVLDIL